MEAKGDNLKVKHPLFAAFLHRTRWPPRNVVMETVKTVLAGAIGIRRCSDAVGAANLNPVHVIIAAIIFVVLFIFTLLTTSSRAEPATRPTAETWTLQCVPG
jgi:DUF2970 family protein